MIRMTLFGLEGKSGFCIRALGRFVADQKSNLSLAESSPASLGERVFYENADESPRYSGSVATFSMVQRLSSPGRMQVKA